MTNEVIHITKKPKVVSDDSDTECISNYSFYGGDDEFQKQVTRYYAQMFEAEQDTPLVVISDTDEVSDTISIISSESGIDINSSDLTSTSDFETSEDDSKNNEPGYEYIGDYRRPVQEQQNCPIIHIKSVNTPSAITVNVETIVSTHMGTTKLKSTCFGDLCHTMPGESADVRGRIVIIKSPSLVRHGKLMLESMEVIIEDDHNEQVTLFFFGTDILTYDLIMKGGDLISVSNGKMGCPSKNISIYVSQESIVELSQDELSTEEEQDDWEDWNLT
ncbi:hypothetical protein QAD02_005752 [Eretmocerus hayati]|uniref:Uncharacterized protein n=1 Tax=Eretmocerus hayati TaxID=131215 RepID=A0ACC2NY70_9HYME|nr:hypothetical protein QAD02_005752 [Eretmocerus hayati]